MKSIEIVNKWSEFLLSDWCSNEFWENTLNQKNQLINDLDKLEDLKEEHEDLKEQFELLKDKYNKLKEQLKENE